MKRRRLAEPPASPREMAFKWHFRVFVACTADVVAFMGTDDSPGLDRSSSNPCLRHGLSVDHDPPAPAVARALTRAAAASRATGRPCHPPRSPVLRAAAREPRRPAAAASFATRGRSAARPPSRDTDARGTTISDMSSPRRSPLSTSARNAPPPAILLSTSSAVGRSVRASSARAACHPPSCVNGHSTISAGSGSIPASRRADR